MALFRYPTFMKEHCPRTCGVCKKVPSEVTNPIIVASKCADKDVRCSAWAAYNDQCRTSYAFMSKMCRKTCRLCQFDEVTEAPEEQDNKDRSEASAVKSTASGLFAILSTVITMYLMKA